MKLFELFRRKKRTQLSAREAGASTPAAVPPPLQANVKRPKKTPKNLVWTLIVGFMVLMVAFVVVKGAFTEKKTLAQAKEEREQAQRLKDAATATAVNTEMQQKKFAEAERLKREADEEKARLAEETLRRKKPDNDQLTDAEKVQDAVKQLPPEPPKLAAYTGAFAAIQESSQTPTNNAARNSSASTLAASQANPSQTAAERLAAMRAQAAQHPSNPANASANASNSATLPTAQNSAAATHVALSGDTADQFAASLSARDKQGAVVQHVARLPTFHQGCDFELVTLHGAHTGLPGEGRAQVVRDVYDCVTGAGPLIPAGSVVVIAQASESPDGTDRLLAAGSRLIFPTGASLDLGAMLLADAKGAPGVPADVDTHFWRRYGPPALIALIARKAIPAPPPSNNSGTQITMGTQAPDSARGVIAALLIDTAKSATQRYGKVKDTLSLPPGESVRIIANKDLHIDPRLTGLKPAYLNQVPQQ